jgi:2,3-bisphosphoglycerate-independent phosphoglycerate mutase
VVDVLVILDGASEPARADRTPTSLDLAATPALDALCAVGTLSRLRTVAPWLAPGSESAIPALLGWTPPAAVDRGLVEAAAHEVPVDTAGGERAWRVDVRTGDGARADADAVRRAVATLADALPAHRVVPLCGHRMLVVGCTPPPLDRLPIASGVGLEAGCIRSLPGAGVTLHPWPEGVVPPRMLDQRTVVVAARGAAAGIGRLMGARVVTPESATGRPGSDLAAKARATVAALDEGAARVVVHVGGPDEAAHEGDRAAKVAALEAADRDVVGPLVAAVGARGGTLRVCPDHGCDPADGLHCGEPVPCVEWTARGARVERGAASGGAHPGAGATAGTGGAEGEAATRPRLTERAVADLPVTDLVGRDVEAAA